MIWTILVLLCVLATKFLTAVRLRGLKAKLEAGLPEIDQLRVEVSKAEGQVQDLRLQVANKTELLAALQDAVHSLEDSIKQGQPDPEAEERVELMKALENQASIT